MRKTRHRRRRTRRRRSRKMRGGVSLASLNPFKKNEKGEGGWLSGLNPFGKKPSPLSAGMDEPEEQKRPVEQNPESPSPSDLSPEGTEEKEPALQGGKRRRRRRKSKKRGGGCGCAAPMSGGKRKRRRRRTHKKKRKSRRGRR